MATEADLTFSIAKLELSPGDILVVKHPPDYPKGLVADGCQMLSGMVPAGVKVLVLPPNVDLSVLTKAEIEAKEIVP